jgi:hypothetical protein
MGSTPRLPNFLLIPRCVKPTTWQYQLRGNLPHLSVRRACDLKKSGRYRVSSSPGCMGFFHHPSLRRDCYLEKSGRYRVSSSPGRLVFLPHPSLRRPLLPGEEHEPGEGEDGER